MKKKEVNFTTTNLQLRTKKKNNLGHPTLPLYSITYLLNTKLASFGIFCQLWQKFVFARECHQKEIDDDVSVSPEKCAYDSTFNKNRQLDEFFYVSTFIYFRFRQFSLVSWGS